MSDHDLDGFRAEVRAWLESNCPEPMRDGATGEENICWGGRNWQFQSDAQRLWLERMAAKGWTVPTWPAEYGGAGLSRAEDKILTEELQRMNARLPLQSFGI
ncbi:MAG: acyl-CoA dehydrogenase family protein, partial [Pseudomonadota bacterium]